jgi:hypothetical protein
MTAEQLAIAGVVIAAGSEIIGMSPLKSNRWVQLILQVLKLTLPKRR